jgi:hypothetical protein
MHFVNPSLLSDATLDAAHPEALIYESRDGMTRLVGVEYIVLFDLWHETHGLQDPPTLEGQLLHFNESPNRTAGVLRAACVGVARQPARAVRRLELARLL